MDELMVSIANILKRLERIEHALQLDNTYDEYSIDTINTENDEDVYTQCDSPIVKEEYLDDDSLLDDESYDSDNEPNAEIKMPLSPKKSFTVEELKKINTELNNLLVGN